MPLPNQSNPSLDLSIIQDNASNSFKNKVVIIRGVGNDTSVGYELARAFGLHGAKLVLVGSSKSRLKEIALRFEDGDIEVMVVRHKLGAIDSIPDSVAAVLERFGRIDVLVNAALVAKVQLLKDARTEDLDRAFFDDVAVPLAWMQACLPHLSQSKGSIISLGSQRAEQGLEGLGALAAATQGFAGLNRIAAKEWDALGVTTNIVQSAARNARFDKLEHEFGDDAVNELASMGVELQSSYADLVRACLFLASEEGHSITGQVISF